MVRKFLTINGEDYDLWEIKTIGKAQEIPEYSNDWEYYIVLNREGIQTNLNAIRIAFATEEERNAELKNIKVRLEEEDESITFI